jgi:hypothetical protein
LEELEDCNCLELEVEQLEEENFGFSWQIQRICKCRGHLENCVERKEAILIIVRKGSHFVETVCRPFWKSSVRHFEVFGSHFGNRESAILDFSGSHFGNFEGSHFGIRELAILDFFWKKPFFLNTLRFSVISVCFRKILALFLGAPLILD